MLRKSIAGLRDGTVAVVYLVVVSVLLLRKSVVMSGFLALSFRPFYSF